MKPIGKTRRHLRRRLTYLWTFELIGSALFLLLLLFWWSHAGFGIASALGVTLVVFVLIQGSCYWFLKLRAINRRPLLSRLSALRLYGLLRNVNQVVLFGAGLSGSVLASTRSIPLETDLLIAGGLWMFAVLEYVNYFHWQLMYDSPREMRWLLKNRRLKVSQLARDLAQAKDRILRLQRESTCRQQKHEPDRL